MVKHKRIILSLIISLAILLIFNSIYSSFTKTEKLTAWMLIQDVVCGEKITSDKLKKVEILDEFLKDNLVYDMPDTLFATTSLKQGQILTTLVTSTSYLEDSKDFVYIALPITTTDDAMAYRIKKGSMVDIYYTAKLKNVNEVLSEKQNATYSSTDGETLITVKLYSDIEVVEVTDNTGTSNDIFSQVILRVKSIDATRLISLKQFGTFTIVLVN